jgi:multidrug efflux system membrane fusion protein
MEHHNSQNKTMRKLPLNFHNVFRPALKQFKKRVGGKYFKKGRKHGRFRQIIIFASLFVFTMVLWACNSSRFDKSKQKPPVPVRVNQIRNTNVPIYIETIGTVTPIDSVVVKTQINGRITEVLFKEGQVVQKGDLLVQIDSQPYEAALEQAEGQLVKDQAILKNARLDLKRYKQLYNEDSISQQTLDTQSALVKQYEGIVQSDQGLVNSAKVNLQYCKITSDITGVVGLRQINPGNYVQTSDTTAITTVNTISPISVVFPIPEDDLGRVQKNFQNATLEVDAFDRKQEHLLSTGTLSALDSQIDNTTGTIKLKATFRNEDFALYPNQFVNVRLKIETMQDAFVVPTAAIQMGRQGTFVYMMDTQKKMVFAKSVTVITNIGQDSAIRGDNLQQGQVVVTQGHDKLTEGSHVIPTNEDHPALPPSNGQVHK